MRGETPSNKGCELRASQSGGTKIRGQEWVGRDGHLSAESAGVLSVLADFNLLHLLTQRGTVTGTVLAHDSNLQELRISDKVAQQG